MIAESNKKTKFEDYYKLIESLGRKPIQPQSCGTFVAVGMEISTRKLYAVKLMQKSVTEADSFGAKQLDSSGMKTIGHLLNLDHKHLVKLRETFETPFSLHIVVELANGEQLFRRLTEFPVYNEKMIVHYFRQVVDGIRYLHEYGIIHRNLKPENILLSTRKPDAIVKITDYSPQSFTTGDLDLELVCVTTIFCAPELLLSRRYDKAVDLWALGILLYIMLCGSDPYKSKTNSDLYYAILHCDIELQSTIWKSISSSGKDVVKRLLMIDPKFRIITPYLLKHQWFIEGNKSIQHLDLVQENLDSFNKQRSEKYSNMEYKQEDWITSEYLKLPRRNSKSIPMEESDEDIKPETVAHKRIDQPLLKESPKTTDE
ncbi:unnamed protein product [Schistosoma turkestanicum]|nr:unnamed protein product [Schistosoma turkestanicum]